VDPLLSFDKLVGRHVERLVCSKHAHRLRRIACACSLMCLAAGADCSAQCKG
jgi:hypothetical protein